MPAGNPNFTWRWYYRYQVGNDIHTVQMRTPDGSGAAGVVQRFNLLMLAIAPQLYLASTVDLSYSAAGSNVRLPVPTTGLAATYGSGTPTPQNSVFGLAFPGRSLQGHKARVYILGVKPQGDANYKYTAAEIPAVGDVRTVLQDSQPNFFCGIDGAQVNWYLYATSKQNDHLIKKRRGT